VIINLQNFSSTCGKPQVDANLPKSWSGNINSRIGECQVHGILSFNFSETQSTQSNTPLQLIISFGGPNFGMSCGNTNINNNNAFPTNGGFPLNMGSSEEVSASVSWAQDQCQFNGAVDANFHNQTSSNYPAGYVIDIGIIFQNVTSNCQGKTGTSSILESAAINATTSASQMIVPSFFSLISLLSLFVFMRGE